MKTLLAFLFAMIGPRYIDEPGAGSADTKDDKGGEKELSLRDEISGAIELDEKGPDAKPDDLSEAARKLAGARKSGQQSDDKGKQQSDEERTKLDAKAKRDAELAAMPEEDRKKAIAEDERKAAEAAGDASIEAPAHWPANVREMFAKQTPEAKKFLLERHKAMEADYTRKTQELAGTKKLHDTIEEGFKPYDEEMRQLGISRDAALRELFGWHARWKADPAAYIRSVAELSKIDLKALVEGGAGEEAPALVALRNELKELRDWKTQFTGGQQKQQHEATMQQVEQFADEKDAQGKPLRPYFDEVAQDVAALIRAEKSQGKTLSLQDAYDRACYANPTTRAKVLAADEAKRKAKDDADRKARAEAARKAADGTVTGEGSASSVAAKTDGSVRGDLEAAFADSGDRV